MIQVSKEIISSLKKIRNQIDSLQPGDTETLIQIGSGLEQITSQVPENLTGVSELLMICLNALQAIFEEQINDFSSLIRCLSLALVAVEQLLVAPPNQVSEELLTQAKTLLNNELTAKQSAPAQSASASNDEKITTENAAETKPADLSLDETGALLMSINPQDAAQNPQLCQLRDSLKTLSGRASASPVKKLLIKAARETDKIISGKASDPDETLFNVGELIEQANKEIADAEFSGQMSAAPVISPAQAVAQKAPPSETPQPVKPIVKESKAPVQATPNELQPDEIQGDADTVLLAEFITESNELLEAAEVALLALEVEPDNLENVNMVFRAFHTVKGSAAFLGLKRLTELAHLAESLLSRIRDREIRCTGGYANLAFRSADALKEMLSSVQEALNGQPMKLPACYQSLIQILTDPQAAGVSEETKVEISAQETPVKPSKTVDKAKKGNRIGDILVAQKKVTREQVEEANLQKGAELFGETLVRMGFVTSEDLSQALQFQKQAVSNVQKTTEPLTTESAVRVRTDRLDSLIDMVGELVIAQSMLAQDAKVLDETYLELSRKIMHSGKIVRELQDLSMAMRMVPLKATFQKMARVVRDVAQKCGKQVEFVTEGEETEIDRNLVDVIADPLVHMVRNAVDHGIELPTLREAAGKAGTGKVRLAAYHSGGNVVVELKDDGKGLDSEKLFEKAVSKGLVEPDKKMSESEIFNLIFAPGFSTAEQVTDVSGRGVGMDVVRRNIESMRGRVEISSEKGHGSTFTVRLPLTLAITDGMLVRIGSERFIVPTVNIHLSFRPTASMVSSVSGRGEMVLLRGELLPIYRLHQLFDVKGAVEDPMQGLLMIVSDGRRRCALLGDELLGQQQVVAKSLGRGISKAQGVSGGAILADGRVGLILDTAEIVALARQTASSSDRKESLWQTAA